MPHALSLAALGRYTTFPNPRVGCVLVKDGRIIGEGFHAKAGEPHAEVFALRQAGEAARGATAYVTLEPCAHTGRTPPCALALIAAGVAKVVIAQLDPNPLVAGKGVALLEAAGIQVEVGEGAEAARALNLGFLSRMERQRPYVVLKMAASLDGRVAMASGESQWITGTEARADGHRWRAELGAVLTTADTVLADDPALTVRHVASPRPPDRIVWDRRARTPRTAKVWQDDGARRIWLTSSPQSLAGVENLVVQDIETALASLAQAQINSLLLECGSRAAAAWLPYADEVLLYLAPCFLGNTAQPLWDVAIERLADKQGLEIQSVQSIGADIRLTLKPQKLS